jgi:transposase
MKFNVNSLPNDPEQLKQMLLELQQRMDNELAQKAVAYKQLLERYNLKLANEYGKKSEKSPGADEVFNEAELVLDKGDNKKEAKRYRVWRWL